MTEGQLALIRHILEQIKEGNQITLDDNEKVDCDSAHTYFNNLLLDIEKNKKQGKVGKSTAIAYRMVVEINK